MRKIRIILAFLAGLIELEKKINLLEQRVRKIEEKT